MTPDGDRDLTTSVVAALAHPSVRHVELVGSRAAGTPTPLSDWDYMVEVADFPSVAADLPALVSELQPLAQQWDRLTSPWCYMLMLRGPVKVDLIFADEPRELEPPWTISVGTLPGIDEHFWDWTLLLVSKRLGGKDELVRAELQKMSRHLLQPMGVVRAPRSIEAAVARYRAERDRLESRLGIKVSRRLELEVLAVIPSR